MKNIPRLRCTYAGAASVPPASWHIRRRRAGMLAALPLAMTIVVADAYAAVVNYADAVRQGVDVTTGLSGAAALAPAPDGTRLYVAAAADSAVTILERAVDGGLAPGAVLLDDSVGGDADGLSGVSGIAVSPDGNHVYTVALNDQALEVFARTAEGLVHVATYRNGTTGIAGLRFPYRVAVSPDGTHVYVATRDPAGADAVLAFAVLDADGRLGLLARYEEGVGGNGDIGNASGLAVSADGRQLYVSGGDGIAVFARDADAADAGFGTLQWTAGYRDGSGGVDGVQGAGALALDPTGTHLYVAGTAEDAVAVFARDATNGTLTFLAAYRNDTGGISGLDGPLALAVSADGGHVYAAGAAQHALVILRRDPLTGLLSPLETHRNGDGGNVDGLDTVLALAASPNGAQLYTASPLAAAVGVFAVTGADLALDMNKESAGTGAAWRLTVSNRGPASATSVRLTDELPAGATLAAAQAPAGAACTQSGGRVVCEIAALAAGATAEVQLQLSGAGTGSHAGAVYADQRDPDPTNNTAGEAVQGNRAPVAVADSAHTRPDTAVDIAVLANDSDPDGDALTVSSVATTSLHGGSVALNPDGTLRYTPATGFRGTDTFDYTVSDGLAGVTTNVSVVVNTPPQAGDDAVTTRTDAAIEILVLSNDSDADADALQVGAVAALSAAGGTVVNNGGSVGYTPPASFTGSDSFTYTVSDGLETATATVTVTVTPPTGSGVTVEDPDDGEAPGSHGGGALDAWWCLALLPWALGRRTPRCRTKQGAPAAGRTAAPRR